MGEDPQGESRAITKKPAEVSRKRKKVQPLQDRFGKGSRVRQDRPTPNCNGKLLECSRKKSGQDKATALCFALATRLELPTPDPAGVASRCERCAKFSLNTR